MLTLPDIDFQEQYYYARPKSMAVRPKSLDEVDPALLATYEKLGIPLKEQMILAGVERWARRSRDGGWRSTRSSTRCRSGPPSRTSWRRSG